MTTAYDALPGIRWSVLSAALDSGKHLQHRMQTPRADTAAMAFGRVLHCAVLEPERFDREAVSVPAEYLTESGAASKSKAAKEWRAGLPADSLLVSPADRDTCLRIRDAVDQHEDARVWLAEARHREHVVTWTEREERHETPCKAKLDAICPRLQLAWDLKTKNPRGGANHPHRCAAEIAARHYHAQLCGWYARGWEAAGNPPFGCYGWIFVEPTAPFDVVAVEADEDMVARGRELAEQALAVYTDGAVYGRWYGAAPRKALISLPVWARGDRGEDLADLGLTGLDEEE